MGGTASGPPAWPWREGAGLPVGRGRGSRSWSRTGRRAARAQSSSSSLAAAVGTRSCTLKQPTKKLMMDRYRCCLRGALWK